MLARFTSIYKGTTLWDVKLNFLFLIYNLYLYLYKNIQGLLFNFYLTTHFYQSTYPTKLSAVEPFLFLSVGNNWQLWCKKKKGRPTKDVLIVKINIFKKKEDKNKNSSSMNEKQLCLPYEKSIRVKKNSIEKITTKLLLLKKIILISSLWSEDEDAIFLTSRKSNQNLQFEKNRIWILLQISNPSLH